MIPLRIGKNIQVITVQDGLTVGDVRWAGPEDCPVRLVSIPPMVLLWHADGRVSYPRLSAADLNGLLDPTSADYVEAQLGDDGEWPEELLREHPDLPDLVRRIGLRTYSAVYQAALDDPASPRAALPDRDVSERIQVRNMLTAFFSDERWTADARDPDEVHLVPMTTRELRLLDCHFYKADPLNSHGLLLRSMIMTMRARLHRLGKEATIAEIREAMRESTELWQAIEAASGSLADQQDRAFPPAVECP